MSGKSRKGKARRERQRARDRKRQWLDQGSSVSMVSGGSGIGGVEKW
jgi:hypothetical protein